MRKSLAVAATGAFLLLGATAAFADRDVPGPDWITADQVTSKLQAAGYSNVTGLHADDGHWEGKGLKDGKIVEFHVDPHSGQLTKEEIDND